MMTINNKNVINDRGKCLGLLVTSYDPGGLDVNGGKYTRCIIVCHADNINSR